MSMIEIAPGTSMTPDEQRFASLEEKVLQLQQQLALETQLRLTLQHDLTELSKRTQLQQAQTLHVLGETIQRQATAMLKRHLPPPKTVVKLVPQEEAANSETLWAIKDGDIVTLFSKKNGQFTLFTHSDIDMDAIKEKFISSGIEDGRMVSINVYLVRD